MFSPFLVTSSGSLFRPLESLSFYISLSAGWLTFRYRQRSHCVVKLNLYRHADRETARNLGLSRILQGSRSVHRALRVRKKHQKKIDH